MSTPTPSHTTREIWFLTGSQHLHGDETLAQVASQSRAVAEQLANSGAIPASIVWKPVLVDAAAIHSEVLEERRLPPPCGSPVTTPIPTPR